MNSFPSALNESKSMYGSGKYQNYRNSFDISKLKALNLNLSAPIMSELLKESNINIANYNYYQGSTYDNTDLSNSVFRENPMMLPYDIIALAKNYEWKYREPAVSILDREKPDSDDVYAAAGFIAPSMFTPLMGVNVRGITSNVPLLNNANMDDGTGYMSEKQNLSSCSIRELCTLSKTPNSILGMATYKYADFMYCKDLGKISNNHLITLRRFAHPVPDHIFELTGPRFLEHDEGFMQEGDIARLVTWFGTEENKLEDIIKFSFGSTWRELNSKIQEQDSTADDSSTGILGLLGNTVNDSYTKAMEVGASGTHNLWTYIGGQFNMSSKFTQGVTKNNRVLYSNYDENRVYNPKNTVQDTYQYEGKIVFQQEFTLNFSYKLRAYDNINPKSAFLDLIGNILEVSGRRGRFWGGQRKLIGPPTNLSMFQKTDAIINKAFDKLGGVWTNFLSGGIDFNSFMGQMAGLVGEAIKNGWKGAKDIHNYLHNGGASKVAQSTLEQAKGLIKNALGRPTMIAWNSLLDGSDVGLWHVTIGNPKNPIMVMGNLIVTNSEITQSGPLGLDDFPTELHVAITLKHARPRDITDIGRMYTKGMSSIYHSLAPGGLDNYFDSFSSYSNSNANMTSKEIGDLQKGVSKEQKDKGTPQKTQDINNNSPKLQAKAMLQAKDSMGNLYETYNMNGNMIPNPFITDNLSLRMSQMNNYSSIMAKLSADEIV